MAGEDSGTEGRSEWPAQIAQHYQSQGQVQLNEFLGKFKSSSATVKANEREKQSAAHAQAGSDSEKDEVVAKHDDQKGFKKVADTLFQSNATPDATGCHSVQSLKEYMSGQRNRKVQSPKDVFFDLSRNYYQGKYKGETCKEIEVKSYLITDDGQNYIKDLSMEIIQTNQGCMPIIKTYEWNAYNKKKFVKAIKFYNYRGDCKIRKQIIVDEGIMTDKFRTYDTSTLHFGNFILFYKREENWHKLQKYDVVNNILEEVDDRYTVKEPTEEGGTRYHLMFSVEFGKKKSEISSKGRNLDDFLKQFYVMAQSYKITEQMEYVNEEIELWPMSNMGRMYNFKHSSGIQTAKKILDLPIQYVCHTEDPVSKKVTFLAFDSFNSNNFVLDPQLQTYSEFETFEGNNEMQMQNNKGNQLLNDDEREMLGKEYYHELTWDEKHSDHHVDSNVGHEFQHGVYYSAKTQTHSR